MAKLDLAEDSSAISRLDISAEIDHSYFPSMSFTNPTLVVVAQKALASESSESREGKI